MSSDFDDLFGNGALEPEPKSDRLPSLGLIVAPRCRTKAECGYDELAVEAAAYLEQVRKHGRFIPEFEDEDPDDVS